MRSPLTSEECLVEQCEMECGRLDRPNSILTTAAADATAVVVGDIRRR